MRHFKGAQYSSNGIGRPETRRNVGRTFTSNTAGFRPDIGTGMLPTFYHHYKETHSTRSVIALIPYYTTTRYRVFTSARDRNCITARCADNNQEIKNQGPSSRRYKCLPRSVFKPETRRNVVVLVIVEVVVVVAEEEFRTIKRKKKTCSC
ncbi:hypothetical protein DPMN_132624 [Dreissena polymorpha]|uniref:Uncharacterized protein n=1 Tax=Dreissena polymorpha TaxID=45954 RepID=A0A9D4FSU5_DREPO|nr:hypothetical protein DPMN_132624 [Dreissena polymorpha]